MNTPEQSFKQSVSFYFVLLIAVVILGFYLLAYRDEVVRRAVFSGPVGLQFIALFSIVIAIILFGITTILEAKELAALLGSLSGYILGRTTANFNNGSNSAPTTPSGQNPSVNTPEQTETDRDSVNIPIPCVIEPSSGRVDGGETVTIRETGFKGVKSVMFGETPAVDPRVEESVIKVTVPAHVAGTVEVAVESDDGKKAHASFEYLDA